jgi:cytoskeletal protein RodZ
MKFFKKLGLKIQLVFGAVLGLIGVAIFFFIRWKIITKDYLNFEIKKAKSESEISKLEEKSEESLKKIEELSKEESKIREKIHFVEGKEIKSEEVSLEDLDKFFDDRGF